MLTEICEELHNFFCKPQDIQSGEFTIENGSIGNLSFLQSGQYFRIVGSVFNDGVWRYGVDTDLHDEVFSGQIWPMSIPKQIIDLDAEATQWISDNAAVLNSPYQSESFAGYSYSKAVSASGDGNGITWQTQFAGKLKPYRKLRVL